MTRQAELPLDLTARLQEFRTRYASALAAAGRGDFAQAGELRQAGEQLGRILAEEARRGSELRGGICMVDVLLLVDRTLPELRQWNQHELLKRHRRIILSNVCSPAKTTKSSRRSVAS